MNADFMVGSVSIDTVSNSEKCCSSSRYTPRNPMTQQHPITPPPDLVKQWLAEIGAKPQITARDAHIILHAAQWGADQELEACCKWVSQWRCEVGGNRPEAGLREFRRPKPLSLKQQALEAFDRFTSGDNGIADDMRDCKTIRRALEALPND